MSVIPSRPGIRQALLVACVAALGIAIWRNGETEPNDRSISFETSDAEAEQMLSRERLGSTPLVEEDFQSVAVQESEDRWSDAVVVASKTTPLSPDNTRWRSQRIIAHPEMRYRILVEETIVNSDTGTEKREVDREIAADHLLLTTRPGVSIETLRTALEGLGLRVLGRVSEEGPFLVAVSKPLQSIEAVPAFVAELNGRAYAGIVEYADYDFVRRITAVPDDPYYDSGDLWGLDNRGLCSGAVAGVDIESTEGWDTRYDASEIVVAVVDTGVRYTHEDLADNIWVNTDEIAGNGIDDDGNGWVDDIHGINSQLSPKLPAGGDPVDENGHGTHVAGTIGAVGDNGVGVTGVAWKVQLMALRFLTGSGAGLDSDAIQCIDYAIQNGADIINSSWGGDGVNRALYDAVERASDAGVIFVAAAGNGGDNIDVDAFTPGGIDLPNVVTVGNHDHGGDLHSTSNFGAGKVDLVAPGTRIRSTTHRSDNAYGYKTGTSMGTPHVSGILALVNAQYPDEDFQHHIERVLQGAIDAPGQASLSRTGARASLAGALGIQNLVPTSPTRFSLSSAGARPLLSWDINWSGEIDGFRIEKKIDDGDWNFAGFVGPNERRFEDPILSYSTNARYRLSAVNAIGESLPSQLRRLNTLVQSIEPDSIELPSGDRGIGFGETMDAYGDVLIVGAPLDDDAGDESGSVYVYERIPGSSWEYRQKLIGSDSKEYDNFGHAVSIDDSLILVGAYNADTAGTDAGAVYLFERDANSVWGESGKLVAEGLEAQDRFGFSVSASGSTLAISARDDDDSGLNAGAVYVFERDAEGDWRQEAKLASPSDSAAAYFGWSIEVFRDRLLVGSKGDDQSGTDVGSATLFRRSGGTWGIETIFYPESSSPYSEFGYSVAIDDGTVLIGSPGADGEELDSGAASLYRLAAGQWQWECDFGVPDEIAGGRFGSDLSLGYGRAAIIGRTDNGENTVGFVYEETDEGEWELLEVIADPEESSLLGVSIALGEGVVSVGNPGLRRVASVYDIPDTPLNFRVESVSR